MQQGGGEASEWHASVVEMGRRAGELVSVSVNRADSDAEILDEIVSRELSVSQDDILLRKSPVQQQVTSLTTIVAKSGLGGLRLALLKDGEKFQIRLDEMRPDMFVIGADLRECCQLSVAHERLTKNLAKQEPISCWLNKLEAERAKKPMNSRQLLVCKAMEENLRTGWQGVLARLERRGDLLNEARNFYQSGEKLTKRMKQTEELMETGKKILEASRNDHILNTLRDSIKAVNECFDKFYDQTIELIRLIDLIGIESNRSDETQLVHSLADRTHLVLNRQINNYLYELTRRKTILEQTLESVSSVYLKRCQEFDQNVNNNNSTIQVSSQRRILRPPPPPPPSQQLARKSTELPAMKYQPLRPVEYPEKLQGAAAELEQLLSIMFESELAHIGESSNAASKLYERHQEIKASCLKLAEKIPHCPSNNPILNAQQTGPLPAEAAGIGGQNTTESGDDSEDSNRDDRLGNRLWQTIALIEARLNILQKAIGIFEMCEDSDKALDGLAKELKTKPMSQELFERIEKDLDFYDVPAIIAAGTAFLSELIQYGRLLGASTNNSSTDASNQQQQPCLIELNLRYDSLLGVLRDLNLKLTNFKVDYLSQRLLFNRRNEDSNVRFYINERKQIKKLASSTRNMQNNNNNELNLVSV